jgi:hypothetical protein
MYAKELLIVNKTEFTIKMMKYLIALRHYMNHQMLKLFK